MPTTPSAVRAQLEAQLAGVLRRAGKIDADLRKNLNRDWAEQAVEIENDQVLEGLDELSRTEIRQIRAALKAIAENTYGTCASCGTRISDERQAALPSTLVCSACAGASRSPA